MKVKEFNDKYKKYLAEDHLGLEIYNVQIINYLDYIFSTLLVNIESFKYSQIRVSIDGEVIFYSSLDNSKANIICDVISHILKLNDKTYIFALTHSSNVEEIKKLIPFIDILPEAGLGAYEQRELVHKLIGKMFYTFSEIIVNQIGNLIYKKVYKNTDFVIYYANCYVYPDQSYQNHNFGLAKYDEEGYLKNWPIGYFDPGIE